MWISRSSRHLGGRHACVPPAVARSEPRSHGCSVSHRALVFVVLWGALATSWSVQSAAAAPAAGIAQVTVPGEPSPLRSGGSATPYAVALPQGARCPGDTAHDGYHVFTYLVPRGESPAAVSFRTGVPSRWFGYIAAGAYYGAVNTAENTGEIVALPTEFTWSRLTPGDLFVHGASTATWEGGIACANVHGVVTNYWNTQVVFKASSVDAGGFTWYVDGTDGPVAQPSGGTNWGLPLGIALVGVALALGGIALTLRRRLAAQENRVEH